MTLALGARLGETVNTTKLVENFSVTITRIRGRAAW
jgi:hypothetical protein